MTKDNAKTIEDDSRTVLVPIQEYQLIREVVSATYEVVGFDYSGTAIEHVENHLVYLKVLEEKVNIYHDFMGKKESDST